MALSDLPLSVLCGQIIVGGFSGIDLPPRFATALREGRRGGAILFRRNLPDLAAAHRIASALVDAAGPEHPPFIAVDQEGGRVARLHAPFPKLTPMRVLGTIGDTDLVRRAGRAVGEELLALGFNLDFAPVLDVDSNPDNPIIGDRAFSHEPARVAACAVAFAEGLESAGVLSCGKHFPGHGDTSVDSHVDLPIIHHDRARLDAVELPPFRAAAAAGIATMMTAHIVVTSIDPSVPATMSRAVCTDLLRGDLGFRGVLFSDDLEMAAVAARYPIETSAVASIEAGCDALLVCSDEDLQDRAHEALVRAAERDPRFRARVEEAVTRSLEARRRMPPRPVPAEKLASIIGGAEGRAVLEEIASRALAAREGA
ncbi:beta-N-acetylhexosaminidase [Polyangium aurulentum]|uniref:beta-N-acetylhexosaminidase n=1 Tax=Polyangium aurulentum TaxID=2567896 RepID=UPI0010AEE40F|nr:beta-N-acetylhexosaminidase [Polyangium aurulentum]UQA59252.1 beta-N-acetylhexosaminidase [Polyangium aurulentum]